MLWLGIHLPLLPLEICQAGCVPEASPAASPEPASVVTEDGRVLLRNAAARQAGIAVGTSLATAHSIVPALTHQPRNLERELRRLTLLGEALYGFSARVCLAAPQPGASSAGVMLEIGASLKLFGNAETLTRRVAALCRDLGHQIQWHTAATPLAALILARAGASDTGDGVSTFDDVALPHAAVEPERLSRDRIERLANMGVHTLGQLLALPAQGVARRFGADLTDYLARIRGDRPDPRPTLQPAECFRTALHLLEPLSDKQALAFPMQRLLSDLQHWLVARQLGARQICWHFAPAVGQATRMPVHFARPRQNRVDFLDITRLQLGEAVLPDEVLDITLEARRLSPWSPDSGSLFAGSGDVPGSASGCDELAGRLVDQLHARLGPGACYSLACTDQHTPEQAWRPTPLLKKKRLKKELKQKPPARPRPGTPADSAARLPGPGSDERPLWLFDPPRPVRSTALTLLRGPERIHTGWWLNEAQTASGQTATAGHARDYYVARHRDGAQCWVFVDPWDRWFLHGYFA